MRTIDRHEADGAHMVARPASRSFLKQALELRTVDELAQAFACAIAECGFICFGETRSASLMDRPPTPIISEGDEKPGHYDIHVVVETWIGDWVSVVLKGHAGMIDECVRARASLLATLFVARREQLAN